MQIQQPTMHLKTEMYLLWQQHSVPYFLSNQLSSQQLNLVFENQI